MVFFDVVGIVGVAFFAASNLTVQGNEMEANPMP
jgi:hypothetical protein